MLSEEEKKSIKLLEDIKNNSWTTKYIMSSDSKNADILLNHIAKLQKENEELKQENERIKYFSSNLFIDDYIPKRVIKNKIKEKQDKINKLHSASDCVIIDELDNQISVLQEILESSDKNE